jgi:ribosomal-protein-alanine N-acetyltransferase
VPFKPLILRLMQTTLITQRLRLVPLRRPLLEAFASSRAELSRLLAVDVPIDWPVATELIPFVLRRLDTCPQSTEWLPWAIIDLQSVSLAGDAGFKGALDKQGCCEIGYSIIPSFRHRGYATEAVAGIVGWARLVSTIRSVRAETSKNNLPSQRVLEKNGFVFTGEYPHPEVGFIRRYELPIPRSNICHTV